MAYANVKDSIFTGSTGRELRRHPAEVRELQFWLVCGPGRDPFGIFSFEPDIVAPQLGRPAKKIREALDVLVSLEFCRWDEQTQYVWVIEMAHHQFLTPLKAVDKRCTTAQKWYAVLPRNPFLGPWFDRYEHDFHLGKGDHAVYRREWGERDQPRGLLDAPSGGGIDAPCTELSVLPIEEPSSPKRDRESGVPAFIDPDAPLKGTELDRQFERIWQAHPRAVEKKLCRAKFGTLKPTLALVEAILTAIQLQAQGRRWRDGFIPNLVNWLEGHRWLDRVEVVAGPTVTDRTSKTITAAERFAERRREP